MTDPRQTLHLLARVKMMRLRLAARGLAVRGAIYMAALLIALGGLAMLVLGLYLSLVPAYGVIQAALITGGVLIALALVAGLAARLAGRSGEERTLAELEALLTSQLKTDLAGFEAPLRKLPGGGKDGWLAVALMLAAQLGDKRSVLRSLLAALTRRRPPSETSS